MTELHDAVVVGAGPYGLSVTAHLLSRHLDVAVLGRPMEMWREHMPAGMLLRSQWWATNLSAPAAGLGIADFAAETGRGKTYPMPVNHFIEYADWFRARAVPRVDTTYASAIERADGSFLVSLTDGRQLRSRAVVMAIGLHYYAHRPSEFDSLPAALVSHSSDNHDLGRFRGCLVVVIGGGQSAIEYAALLNEAGARVHVVYRRKVKWWGPDRSAEKTWVERLRAPNASIAPGWTNWFLDKLPYLFQRLPQAWKDSYNANYQSGASDWLRNRVLGKVTLHEGVSVAKVTEHGSKITATLSDGGSLEADHIMLATGFRTNLNRLPMLHSSLSSQVRTESGIPILNSRFETSVPGLFFVGHTALRSFGPLFRFVAGCGAAARRVAGAIDR